MKNQWLLYDDEAKVFAGLDKTATIKVEESSKDAVVFDGRDNKTLKTKYYNHSTGYNFKPVAI